MCSARARPAWQRGGPRVREACAAAGCAAGGERAGAEEGVREAGARWGGGWRDEKASARARQRRRRLLREIAPRCRPAGARHGGAARRVRRQHSGTGTRAPPATSGVSSRIIARRARRRQRRGLCLCAALAAAPAHRTAAAARALVRSAVAGRHRRPHNAHDRAQRESGSAAAASRLRGPRGTSTPATCWPQHHSPASSQHAASRNGSESRSGKDLADRRVRRGAHARRRGRARGDGA